jgi:hypothetical protein
MPIMALPHEHLAVRVRVLCGRCRRVLDELSVQPGFGYRMPSVEEQHRQRHHEDATHMNTSGPMPRPQGPPRMRFVCRGRGCRAQWVIRVERLTEPAYAAARRERKRDRVIVLGVDLKA